MISIRQFKYNVVFSLIVVAIGLHFNSCKKDKLQPDIESSVTGKDSIELNKEYSYTAPMVDGAVYIWTAQSPLEIVDGQGTHTIKLRTSAKFSSVSICVNIKSRDKTWEACKEIYFYNLPVPVLTIGTNRYKSFSFVVNNKAYFGGGSTSSYYSSSGNGYGNLNDFYEFRNDSSSLKLTYKTLPIYRANGISFTINNMGYIGFGVNSGGTYYKDIWEYNPLLDTWSQKAACPGNKKCGAGAFVANNLAYVVTGYLFGGALEQTLWQYDPVSNTWIQKNNTPVGLRRDAQIFGYNNKGYVIGGWDTNNFLELADVWEYNPTADSWQQLPDCPGTPTDCAVTFLVDDKLYFTGGFNYLNYLWEWNLTSGVWTKQPAFNFSFGAGCSGFSLNGKGYIFGGQILKDGNYYTNNQLYEFN